MSSSSSKSKSNAFIRWLRLKRYQYEVTFPLYMLTPMEKFIFNSFLFLFLSMFIWAATFYFPQHIMTIASRAWFYYAGDEDVLSTTSNGGGAGGGGGGGVGGQGMQQGMGANEGPQWAKEL